jgi:hypothetical protein
MKGIIMNITWKERLKSLEEAKQWDFAIDFMQKVIKENPDDIDAYMFMNFLLMDLLVEEEHDKSKNDYYETLAKWYFDESYAKFSDNPEFLYITAKTAGISEWYFGIDVKDYEAMIQKAQRLDPNNLVYKESYYWNLRDKNPRDPELIAYAHLILSEDSPLKKQLQSKGSVGEYLLGIKENWCKEVLYNAGETLETTSN